MNTPLNESIVRAASASDQDGRFAAIRSAILEPQRMLAHELDEQFIDYPRGLQQGFRRFATE